MSGEAVSVAKDMTAVVALGTSFPALLSECEPAMLTMQAYFILEMLLNMKQEPCSGGKKSKEWITFLVCANMIEVRSYRCHLLESQQVQDVSILPVQYKANHTKLWWLF